MCRPVLLVVQRLRSGQSVQTFPNRALPFGLIVAVLPAGQVTRRFWWSIREVVAGVLVVSQPMVCVFGVWV